MTVNEILNNYCNEIEEHLNLVLPESGEEYKSVINAMRYSLMLGGKRLRPVLLLEFCRLVCGEYKKALNFACALEMIHTYSLIHDDLPCMDDDEMRRGKPSCHIAFSESTALLAGDGLLTYAFETALTEDSVEADKKVKAANVLANLSGIHGMIGGQVIDLESEGKNADFKTIEKMYSLKTGALIRAAANIGCIIGGATKEQLNAADIYAKNIGLAFQIVDDILDITSTSEELGKKVGSDSKLQKSTYVSYYGLEESQKLVEELTSKAILALDSFNGDKTFLIELAKMLQHRRK